MKEREDKTKMVSYGKEQKAAKKKSKEQKKKWKEMKLIKKLEKEFSTSKKECDEEMMDANVSNVKKSADSKKQQGRRCTVSMAVPGSILNNAQSPELRTYLAGQIGRAAVIFNIDEVVVYNDGCRGNQRREDEDGLSPCDKQLARILQYLECPQYLRKQYFPQHSDLNYAGILNPLDCPHHMRIDEVCAYREGCVLERPASGSTTNSLVNCGMRKEVRVDRGLQPGVRVTVKIQDPHRTSGKVRGTVVSPRAPHLEAGLYWGYTVRLAASLSAVFTECPYGGGGRYTLTIGTSDKGRPIDDLHLHNTHSVDEHMLLVFGGVDGLESALESDQSLTGVSDVSSLFHHYVNVCPNQGSRTIRTEEAILIALAALRPKLNL